FGKYSALTLSLLNRALIKKPQKVAGSLVDLNNVVQPVPSFLTMTLQVESHCLLGNKYLFSFSPYSD
ncbi:MAG: hypothetical protein ACUVQ1_08570, partial [Candidatus Kapaibacteriales bacterium]